MINFPRTNRSSTRTDRAGLAAHQHHRHIRAEPLMVVDAKLGQWWLVCLGSIGAITAGVLLAGLHRRFAQLLDDSQSPSPFTPMVRVAGVAGICSIMGSATGVVVWWH